MSQANPTDIQTNAYAENYIVYGDQSKAWRVAYPEAKCKPENVHTKASLMHDMTKVQQRITDLQKIAKKNSNEKFELSDEYLKKALATVIQKGLKDKTDAQQNTIAHNLAAVVSAIGEVNRMDGNHAPTKQVLSGDSENPLTLMIKEISGNTLGANEN